MTMYKIQIGAAFLIIILMIAFGLVVQSASKKREALFEEKEEDSIYVGELVANECLKSNASILTCQAECTILGKLRSDKIVHYVARSSCRNVLAESLLKNKPLKE